MRITSEDNPYDGKDAFLELCAKLAKNAENRGMTGEMLDAILADRKN